jgi:hypothetical protein
MVWQGFVLAFSAAVSHSLIDLLRKVASKKFTATQCVCLVAMLEGSLPFAFVLGQVRRLLHLRSDTCTVYRAAPNDAAFRVLIPPGM